MDDWPKFAAIALGPLVYRFCFRPFALWVARLFPQRWQASLTRPRGFGYPKRTE